MTCFGRLRRRCRAEVVPGVKSSRVILILEGTCDQVDVRLSSSVSSVLWFFCVVLLAVSSDDPLEARRSPFRATRRAARCHARRSRAGYDRENTTEFAPLRGTRDSGRWGGGRGPGGLLVRGRSTASSEGGRDGGVEPGIDPLVFFRARMLVDASTNIWYNLCSFRVHRIQGPSSNEIGAATSSGRKGGSQ